MAAQAEVVGEEGSLVSCCAGRGFSTAENRSMWLQPPLPGMRLPGSWARSTPSRASPLPPP